MSAHFGLTVGVPGRQEPIAITVEPEARGAELVEIIRRHDASGFGETDEIVVFTGDGEKLLELDLHLGASGIGHGHHVHAHRCRHIEARVKFGADEKAHPFSANATVGMVRHWAAEAFGIVPASDYRLELGEHSGYLADDARLYTLAHHCHIACELVHKQLTIHYKVNAEDEESHERFRTARTILREAKLDPENYVLEHGGESYRGRLDVPIRLHEGMIFKATYVGGGTVS